MLRSPHWRRPQRTDKASKPRIGRGGQYLFSFGTNHAQSEAGIITPVDIS